MSAQDFKNKGNDYFKNGKFREAVECAPQIPDSDLSQGGRKKAKRSFVPFLFKSGDIFLTVFFACLACFGIVFSGSFFAFPPVCQTRVGSKLRNDPTNRGTPDSPKPQPQNRPHLNKS